MMYCVQARIERETKHGTVSVGLPTFYLDDRVQGIVGVKHAEDIARAIIDPYHNYATLHVSVAENYGLEQV